MFLILSRSNIYSMNQKSTTVNFKILEEEFLGEEFIHCTVAIPWTTLMLDNRFEQQQQKNPET